MNSKFQSVSFALSLALLLACPAHAQDKSPDWDRTKKQADPSKEGALGQDEPRFKKSAEPQAATPDPIFPEDGSLPMKAWYANACAQHPTRAFDLAELRKTLEAEGVALKDIKHCYDWIQDLSLFSANGKLILQADMPAEWEVLGDLTRGIFNDDCVPTLQRLTPREAEALGLPYRVMEWTLLEGGDLISGRFSDGETYAILNARTLARTRAFHKHRAGRDLSEEKAKELVAADLGIKPENLFAVQLSGLLDLAISPLPGGKILVSDPKKAPDALRGLIAADPPKAQRERLSAMLDLYLNGYQRRYAKTAPADLAGKPMGPPLFPNDETETRQLDAMAEALKGRFSVARAAGEFKEAPPGNDGSGWGFLGERINFFNGVTAAGAKGEVFVATNRAEGLPALEGHWRKLLSEHGVKAERVHFVGKYSAGAGLDGAGAACGK